LTNRWRDGAGLEMEITTSMHVDTYMEESRTIYGCDGQYIVDDHDRRSSIEFEKSRLGSNRIEWFLR
jgi:hypothetical protein